MDSGIASENACQKPAESSRNSYIVPT